MRYGEVILAVVTLDAPPAFRIAAKEHLQTPDTPVRTLAGNAGEGVVDESGEDVLADHLHYRILQYVPRIVILVTQLPDLTIVIVQGLPPELQRWECLGENHPSEQLQVKLRISIVYHDGYVPGVLAELCSTGSDTEVIHISHLLKNITFSFYHTLLYIILACIG